MVRFEDLIAEETKAIVGSVGSTTASDCNRALLALEDKMRWEFEESLGNLDNVPAQYNNTIEAMERIVVTELRNIIKGSHYIPFNIRHAHGLVSDLEIDLMRNILDYQPMQQAVKQIENIIRDARSNADATERFHFEMWESHDLRRIRELLGTLSEDTDETSGFYNVEGESLNGLIMTRSIFFGERRDSWIPQNKEWQDQIYGGLTVDMFVAAEMANPASAHVVRMLREKYDGAIRIAEREFRARFREEFVEETEKKPRIQQAWQRRRRESAPGLGGFIVLWFVVSLFVPHFVLGFFDMNKGDAYLSMALVIFLGIFLPALLWNRLLKKKQLRRFDESHTRPITVPIGETKRKEIVEFIAEECGFDPLEWVEEAELKKAKEDKAEVERKRKIAETELARIETQFARESVEETRRALEEEKRQKEIDVENWKLDEESAEESVKTAKFAIEAKKRDAELAAELATEDAELARQQQRRAAATGLAFNDTSYEAAIKHLGFVMCLGGAIIHWGGLIGFQGVASFLVSCLAVCIILACFNSVIRKYQEWRFDRNHPPPTKYRI